MDERYARAYADLGRTHWWWRARDAVVLQALATHVSPGQNLRVLDVGCGDGRLFEALARYGSVEGIEPDPTSRGEGSPFGTIHLAPFARPLPLSSPFDVILMLDVLEHLPDPVEALRLVYELLAPGGVLVLTVPALSWLWTHHDDINHHHLRYDRPTLVQQLAAGGLHPVSVRYLFHSLVAPKLVVRGIERVIPAGDRSPRALPGPLNRTVAALLTLEAKIARPVAHWLPGSSLMASARKPPHAPVSAGRR